MALSPKPETRHKDFGFSYVKRTTCNTTEVAAPRKSRPSVLSKTRAPPFLLVPDDVPLPVPDVPDVPGVPGVVPGVAAPGPPACVRTHPESLSGWSQKNHGSAG